MQLENLFKERFILKGYKEFTFSKLDFNVGLPNPILFLSDKRQALSTVFYHLNSLEDESYDIHVVSSDTSVLFYVINIKAPHWKLVSNGLIIRKSLNENAAIIKEGVHVRYNLDQFLVLTNKTESATIFGMNITKDPTT